MGSNTGVIDALLTIARGLIPDSVKAVANAVLDKADALLKGEPVLVIGNAAAVVLWLVTNAFGRLPDLTFSESLAAAGAAIVTLNSILVAIRSVVYSPATVAQIVTTPPASAGPVAAAVAAGVPAETVADAAAEQDASGQTHDPGAE